MKMIVAFVLAIIIFLIVIAILTNLNGEDLNNMFKYIFIIKCLK